MSIAPNGITIPPFEGEPLEFVVVFDEGENANDYDYAWKVESTGVPYPVSLDHSTPGRARWDTSGTPAPREYLVTATLTPKSSSTPVLKPSSSVEWPFELQPRASRPAHPLR